MCLRVGFLTNNLIKTIAHCPHELMNILLEKTNKNCLEHITTILYGVLWLKENDPQYKNYLGLGLLAKLILHVKSGPS